MNEWLEPVSVTLRQTPLSDLPTSKTRLSDSGPTYGPDKTIGFFDNVGKNPPSPPPLLYLGGHGHVSPNADDATEFALKSSLVLQQSISGQGE